MKQTKYVLCTLKNIYSSRYLDHIAVHVHETGLNEHWKNAGLYTLATKE